MAKKSKRRRRAPPPRRPPTAPPRQATPRGQVPADRRPVVRRNTRRSLVRTGLLVGAGLIVVFLFLTFGRAKSPQTGPTYARSAPAADPSTLAGIQTGTAPWRAELAHLRERLGALGIPAASGAALHTHEHLDVFVDGNRVTVPANVGINTNQGFLGPLHTHDDSGVIHVESQTNSVFTLGEFFDVWGVRFTPTCIGVYCAGGGTDLRVYVDGHLVRGDPQRVKLIPHQEIAVVFGTTAQLPKPIPSSYTFGVGL